jgi:hypothetical protein
MTDSELEAEFLMGWVSYAEPGLSPTPVGDGALQQSPGGSSLIGTRSSRLAGETEEKREKRLRLARECSARRRSQETAEQRERRLKEQRQRMAHKRLVESPETRETR